MLDVICLMSMIIYITGNPTVNIALHKPTCMSSIRGSQNASYAVDGNTGTNLLADHCAQTAVNDMTPWWMIDLQGTYLVNNVVLTNRDDYWWKLHSFVIEIFEKNPQRCAGAISGVCFNYTGEPLGQGETRMFTCETPARGRFVRISKWKVNAFDDDILTLCEVEIFGNISNECYIQGIRETRLRTNHVELTTGLSPIQCAVNCLGKYRCLAFNFNANTMECERLFNPMFNDTKEILPGWSYYGSDLC